MEESTKKDFLKEISLGAIVNLFNSSYHYRFDGGLT
jgi:hypothetical protein